MLKFILCLFFIHVWSFSLHNAHASADPKVRKLNQNIVYYGQYTSDFHNSLSDFRGKEYTMWRRGMIYAVEDWYLNEVITEIKNRAKKKCVQFFVDATAYDIFEYGYGLEHVNIRNAIQNWMVSADIVCIREKL